MIYKLIQITDSNLFVKVDPEDHESLNKYKWYLMPTGSDNTYLRPVRYEKNKTIRMHREILNAQKDDIIDHKNHDLLDNRKENLRFCSNSQNMMNQKKCKKNTSGFKGVSVCGDKWRAEIWANCERIHLGYFESLFDAAFARKEAEVIHHGEFAC